MDPADERRRRAEARRLRITLGKTSLSDARTDVAPVRGEEALRLVAQLTEESWSAAGRPWPQYERSAIPVRFVRFESP